MEQWILDGRSLLRQRDPQKFVPPAGVIAHLERISDGELRCFTSLLLQPPYCRIDDGVEGTTESRLVYAFDCSATGGGESAAAVRYDDQKCMDLTGLRGMMMVVADPEDGATSSAAAATAAKPAPYAECVADIRWFCANQLVEEMGAFEFVAGAGVVPQAVEEAVLQLRPGETCAVLCDPAFAFRENGLPRGSVAGRSIPANAVVTLHLRLIRFQNPLTDDEKHAVAMSLKEEGNALMAQRDFAGAAQRYQRALSRLASGASVTTSHQSGSDASQPTVEDLARTRQAIRSLKVVLLHNLAVATQSQDEQLASVALTAAGHCTRALTIDPQHAKSRYRRALCYVQSRDWDKATADLRYMESNGLGDTEALASLRTRIDLGRSGAL